MIMGDGWSKCEMTFRLPVAVLTSPDAITAFVVMVAADVCSTFSCLFVKIKGVCFARCIICTNFDDVIIKIISRMTWIIVLVVVVLIVLWLVGMYNNLVRLRNNRENAFANIDVQLKQRYDLVPQLVNTVKGYAGHEKETLEKVTAARAAAMSATTVDEKVAADKALSGALAGLRISLEAYPELKANQNFLQLQNELADIENKLSAARRFFNSTTRELNNACEVFPSNIVAGMFGFRRVPMYEATESRDALNKAPEVKF